MKLETKAILTMTVQEYDSLIKAKKIFEELDEATTGPNSQFSCNNCPFSKDFCNEYNNCIFKEGKNIINILMKKGVIE